MTEYFTRLLKMKDGEMIMCSTNAVGTTDLESRKTISVKNPVQILPYQVSTPNGTAEGFAFKSWLPICEGAEFQIASDSIMIVGTLKLEILNQYKAYLEMRDNPPTDEDDDFEDWQSDFQRRSKLLN
jgi:hypothetical protein